jgi:phage terminase large subunit-like protein
VRFVEELLAEGRLRLKRNPVLISAMMSAVTDEDRWGNHWITKERSVNKIDAAVAALHGDRGSDLRPDDDIQCGRADRLTEYPHGNYPQSGCCGGRRG